MIQEESPPIQKEAIPLALKSYYILGQAPTGTGKTEGTPGRIKYLIMRGLFDFETVKDKPS